MKRFEENIKSILWPLCCGSFVIFSGFSIMSCLCKIGDISCSNACHVRFVWANLAGAISFSLLWVIIGLNICIGNKTNEVFEND